MTQFCLFFYFYVMRQRARTDFSLYNRIIQLDLPFLHSLILLPDAIEELVVTHVPGCRVALVLTYYVVSFV